MNYNKLHIIRFAREDTKCKKMTAYMEVYLGIKEVLREGSYRPGILLPTEVELEKNISC